SSSSNPADVALPSEEQTRLKNQTPLCPKGERGVRTCKTNGSISACHPPLGLARLLRLIGLAGMGLAIGRAAFGLPAAEMEFVLGRIADRPAAHAVVDGQHSGVVAVVQGDGLFLHHRRVRPGPAYAPCRSRRCGSPRPAPGRSGWPTIPRSRGSSIALPVRRSNPCPAPSLTPQDIVARPSYCTSAMLLQPILVHRNAGLFGIDFYPTGVYIHIPEHAIRRRPIPPPTPSLQKVRFNSALRPCPHRRKGFLP